MTARIALLAAALMIAAAVVLAIHPYPQQRYTQRHAAETVETITVNVSTTAAIIVRRADGTVERVHVLDDPPTRAFAQLLWAGLTLNPPLRYYVNDPPAVRIVFAKMGSRPTPATMPTRVSTLGSVVTEPVRRASYTEYADSVSAVFMATHVFDGSYTFDTVALALGDVILVYAYTGDVTVSDGDAVTVVFNITVPVKPFTFYYWRLVLAPLVAKVEGWDSVSSYKNVIGSSLDIVNAYFSSGDKVSLHARLLSCAYTYKASSLPSCYAVPARIALPSITADENGVVMSAYIVADSLAGCECRGVFVYQRYMYLYRYEWHRAYVPVLWVEFSSPVSIRPLHGLAVRIVVVVR